mmetsp:Transcript_86028/g.256631  ORF Transcript_86028/g.256631 Transcript_86028/m.256631 type:complete len:217 (-) Transcript_86028:703-1353(-)
MRSHMGTNLSVSLFQTGYAGCMANEDRSHFRPSAVTLFRDMWSSCAGAWLEDVRNLAMHRRPSLPMLLPVSRSTSDRTPCFSSIAQSAFTPTAVSSFSEKSIVPALNRARPAAAAVLGRATDRRRSIHLHQSVRPSSPRLTSAIEMVSLCGCPGFAASMAQRSLHSGCSSRSCASLSTPVAAGGAACPPFPLPFPGVWGVRCLGGGPEGCLGPNFA